LLGKCYDHNPSDTDCQALWNAFSSAAAVDNRVVNDTYWAPFFQIANFSTAPSTILFWSGNMAFALAVSSNDIRFVTVEETSTGYVTNGLSWCGLPGTNPPQFDYVDPCVYSSNSTYYGLQSYWTQASALFAQGASGNISILLQPQPVVSGNTSVYMAYRPTSIFYTIELPHMIPSQIESITVLLLRNETVAPGEACGTGSLVTLQSDIYKKFGFNYTCIDDPVLIYNIFCPNGTTSGQCLAATLVYAESLQKQLNNSKNDNNDGYLGWAVAVTVLAVIFFVVTLFLVVKALRK